MLVPASFGISTLRLRLCQYIKCLINKYSLLKKKPVIDLDDLYLLLCTHWVLDNSTFKDERQRVQVATGLLRSLFSVDDRVPRKVVNDIEMDEIKDVKSNCDGDTGKSVDAACMRHRRRF